MGSRGDPETVEGIEGTRTLARDDVGRHPHDVSDHAQAAVVVDGNGDRLVRLVIRHVVPDDPDAHLRRQKLAVVHPPSVARRAYAGGAFRRRGCHPGARQPPSAV
jgi:hypothetical protein